MIDVLFVTLLQVVSGDPQIADDPANAASPPAATATSTPTSPASETEPAEDVADDRVRCRREPIVGTRLSQRVCTTARQDRAMAEDSRRMVERAQSQVPLGGN